MRFLNQDQPEQTTVAINELRRQNMIQQHLICYLAQSMGTTREKFDAMYKSAELETARTDLIFQNLFDDAA